VAVYGLEYEQYQKANSNHGNGETVPVCALHQVPMQQVQGSGRRPTLLQRERGL